jgi:acyl-CoA thioesterase FadM
VGTLDWTHEVRVGWTDVDQDGLLTFSSIFRFVAAGYAGMFPLLTKRSRADYFAAHDLQPIMRHMEVARKPRGARLDEGLSVHFTGRLGFTRDARSGSRRFGGHDAIRLIDEHGETLARWTQDWLWFAPKTGELLAEPAPELRTDQSDELPSPEAPPRSSAEAEGGRFRWTRRETDVNRHVTASAYLERAENAVADAGLDAGGLHEADLWFRRPALVGDLMTSSCDGHDDGTLLVSLARAAPDEVCALVRFRRS